METVFLILRNVCNWKPSMNTFDSLFLIKVCYSLKRLVWPHIKRPRTKRLLINLLKCFCKKTSAVLGFRCYSCELFKMFLSERVKWLEKYCCNEPATPWEHDRSYYTPYADRCCIQNVSSALWSTACFHHLLLHCDSRMKSSWVLE